MIRFARSLTVLALAAAPCAAPLAAQMPPSISKPIESARKAAAATDAQTKAAERIKPDDQARQATANAAAHNEELEKNGVEMTKNPLAGKGIIGAIKAAALGDQKDAPKDAPKTGGKGVQLSAAAKATMQFYREEYSWSDAGRRDPFMSLLATTEIRPLIADLILIGVVYDLSGRNSVALLVDGTSSETYRVKVGNIIGRMKVAKIGAESVTLNIDEFGFSRQETLLLDRTRKAGNAPGRRP